MNKLNFFSEGNSIIHYDLENDKEKYYSNKLNMIDKNVDQINYFYKEINKKNKQITELKSIIATLKKAQETLLLEIKTLQNKIPIYSNRNKNKNTTPRCRNNGQEQILLSRIKKLQNENNKLKMRINKSEEKENLFYNNINNKLKKAERDIQILSFENKNNNNIILAIQNFLFNINDKINSENQSLIFDLSLIDKNTFIQNLQILESNIINKINQLHNIGNICLYNSRNSNKKKIQEINYDSYDKNNNINNNIINGSNEKKIKNLKKILKQNKEMNKTINYLNSHNKKNVNKIKFGLIYNTIFDREKNKNNKPFKAYSIRNNYFKELSINDDIHFGNQSTDTNGGRNDFKKK